MAITSITSCGVLIAKYAASTWAFKSGFKKTRRFRANEQARGGGVERRLHEVLPALGSTQKRESKGTLNCPVSKNRRFSRGSTGRASGCYFGRTVAVVTLDASPIPCL